MAGSAYALTPTSTINGATKQMMNSAASGSASGQSALFARDGERFRTRAAASVAASPGEETAAAGSAGCEATAPRYSLISRLKRSISAERCGLIFAQSKPLIFPRSAGVRATVCTMAPASGTLAFVGMMS